MLTAQEATTDRTEALIRRRALERMLDGYRFRVCETRQDVERALSVRRRVYVDELRNTFPIPDQYDHRSWLLLAEDAATGEAIGTMRLTPRAAGPLEVEEHFTMPDALLASDTVEITRFTILPQYRGTHVMAGLLKLMVLCLQEMDARWLVAGATQARIHTYSWLYMESTGITAEYEGLKGQEVTLMACDFPEAARTMAASHPLRDFLLASDSPQIEFSARVTAMLRGWSVKLAS
jgi:hypothetical protein